jgi:hypothetical protein
VLKSVTPPSKNHNVVFRVMTFTLIGGYQCFVAIFSSSKFVKIMCAFEQNVCGCKQHVKH